MDVKKYFDRIGLELPDPVIPNSELLRKLHFAHCTTVPYENVDMIRGVPTSLTEEGLFQKIVEEDVIANVTLEELMTMVPQQMIPALDSVIAVENGNRFIDSRF